MASLRLSKILTGRLNPCSTSFVRHGHMLRGLAPGVAKTLDQRLEALNPVDEEVSKKVDIGFPLLKPSRSAELKQRMDHVKAQRKNVDMEKLARSNNLHINLDQVKQDWLNTNGPFRIRKVAEHFGVFEHLFGKYAYFTPRVFLDIKYKVAEDKQSPVFYGNTVKPSEAKDAPVVNFNPHFSLHPSEKPTKESSLWTLILTNPDSHFKDENQEYVHWMITNIPNNDLSKGELIVPYLQPFPQKGSGYHRHIFVLYKQDKKLDLSKMKLSDSVDLNKRTFNTFEFYKEMQDVITPAGLAFFQSDWDKSITDFYHNVLNIKEPIYEYDFPEAHIKKQVHFPLRQPFNLYMDKYRDPKQIHKEYLQRKLAKTHPFEGPKPKLQYPNAHSIKDVPSWLKTEKKKDRLGWGRINDI